MALHEIQVSEVTDQLRTLGVRPGGVLLVHTSFRAVRPVEGGPHGLIEALRRSPLLFLHEAGTGCAECDVARVSLSREGDNPLGT